MYEHVAQDRPTTALDRPYFAKIADLAEEAERAASYVEEFLARCRGIDTAKSGGGQLAPVPSGHFGQLDRLTNAVGRFDALARELQTIG